MSDTKRHLIVPAFFPYYGREGFKPPHFNPDWYKIEEAGATVKFVIPEASFAEFPQKNGPAWKAAGHHFDLLKQKGQVILGYVDTCCATTAPDVVRAQVHAWYDSYPDQVGGIWFDNGPSFGPGANRADQSDPHFRRYYTTVFQDMKSNPSYHGKNQVLLNASRFPNEWVMEVADQVILWHDTMARYLSDEEYRPVGPAGNKAPVLDWWNNRNYHGRIVHLIAECPAGDAAQPHTSVDLVIQRSKDRAGTIYVHDGKARPTGYEKLPPYWDHEVAVVKAEP